MPRRLEVRCCCDPGKLLGTVPAPAGLLLPGVPIAFVVTPMLPPGNRFDIRQLVIEPVIKKLYLELGEVQLARGDRRLALNSNDTPIETLRRIPGWQEA